MKHFLPCYGKISAIVLGSFIFCNTSQAQYASISPFFANWLRNNGYSTCLNGNLLDTTCSAVTSVTGLDCSSANLTDITGIQYFKNCLSLICSNNLLTSIPVLPDSLVELDCESNDLASLENLPSTLWYLTCDNNLISSLPDLPSGLRWLDCQFNSQQSGVPLTLPTILPPNLQRLNCEADLITSLPALPSTLVNLWCDWNQLTSLPTLPVSLQTLTCSNNAITSLPTLPAGLTALDCDHNQITSMPVLPASLTSLVCYTNAISSLPVLPTTLNNLQCAGNQITSLPALPSGLTTLTCDNNQLTAIPTLPDSLSTFSCSGNANLTCMPILTNISVLNFSGTGVTCLPNYGQVVSSTPPLNTVPLCGVFNPNGCPSHWNISGQCYYDQNNNCVFDGGDVGTVNAKVQLDSAGIVIQQIYTGSGGAYSLVTGYGNYILQIDTTNLPFIVSCPVSGHQNPAVSGIDSQINSNNFAFECRTIGFDLGVQSSIRYGVIPRPGALFGFKTIVGDMSEIYGAHCAAGVAGQVQLTFSGPITYINPQPGSLNPTSVVGNTITWSVADFGTIDNNTAFNLAFSINAGATSGDQVCFTVNVTPATGDYNPGNNNGSYCFTVVNSLDPNEKEVSPSGVIDTSQHWLTYTIRFQNSGTAPALNINILDTLDSNLDASSFQLLASSSKVLTQLTDNVVMFAFANINLPDSITNDSASRGYVQYKIRLKNNLPIGTEIQNTADVYFDLNSAVATNTTTNFVGDSISAINNIANELVMFELYPNPAKNYVIAETDESAIGGLLEVTDIAGREVVKAQITSSKYQIPTSNFSDGIYFVKVSDNTGRSAVRKLVVE